MFFSFRIPLTFSKLVLILLLVFFFLLETFVLHRLVVLFIFVSTGVLLLFSNAGDRAIFKLFVSNLDST